MVDNITGVGLDDRFDQLLITPNLRCPHQDRRDIGHRPCFQSERMRKFVGAIGNFLQQQCEWTWTQIEPLLPVAAKSRDLGVAGALRQH